MYASTDITDGIIQCCNGFGLNSSFMFEPFDSPPFQKYLDLGKSVHVTIGGNIDDETGDGLCTSVWNNRDQIANAMISSALKTNVTGYNLDWESAVPNNVACFVKVWGYVKAKLQPHGIEFQTDIDNHAGGGGDPSPWGYLWNYGPMIPVFDTFVNMGTYPSNSDLPAASNVARIKSYISMMLAKGVKVDQISAGLSASGLPGQVGCGEPR